MTKITSSRKSSHKNRSNQLKIISPGHPLSKIQEHPALSLLTVLFLLVTSLTVYLTPLVAWSYRSPDKAQNSDDASPVLYESKENKTLPFHLPHNNWCQYALSEKQGLDLFHIV